MYENIKIKMELLDPTMWEEKYYDIIWLEFCRMLEDIKKSKFSINIYGNIYDIKPKIIKVKNCKSVRYYATLILTFQIDMYKAFSNLEIYKSGTNKKVNLSIEEKIAYGKSVLNSEIEKYVMDLFFAMNLAHPGLFQIANQKVYFNNKEIKNLRKNLLLVDWLDTYINFLKNKWPKISMLKFENVWKWLSTKTNFLDGISKIAIDRALNALTYTIHERSYEEIFYVLMGLEAIYNDNDSNGITEQIRAKTEALLNRPETFKKKISKFYENRSQFIHGKLNFPNKYCTYDATKEFEEFYYDKYLDTVSDALAILLSTIQEYIIRNKSSLKIYMIANLED